jgi:hypothetical protein
MDGCQCPLVTDQVASAGRRFVLRCLVRPRWSTSAFRARFDRPQTSMAGKHPAVSDPFSVVWEIAVSV